MTWDRGLGSQRPQLSVSVEVSSLFGRWQKRCIQFDRGGFTSREVAMSDCNFVITHRTRSLATGNLSTNYRRNLIVASSYLQNVSLVQQKWNAINYYFQFSYELLEWRSEPTRPSRYNDVTSLGRGEVSATRLHSVQCQHDISFVNWKGL